MTFRERLSLILLGAGVVGVLAAAYGYDGVRGLVAVGGVLCLLVGVLLGFTDAGAVEPVLEELELGEPDDAGQYGDGSVVR